MAVRANVAPLSAPGHALLRVSELDAAPEGLTLSIQRQQGPDTHLADDGWRRTETWLLPDEVSRRGDVLEFHLGPEICDRLAGIATVRLRVKEPDIGVVGTTVVAWPAMLTSGAADGSNPFADDVVRLRHVRERAAPPPEPEPEPPPVVEPPRPAVFLLLGAGAGYFVWTNYFQEHEPAVAVTPPTAPPAPTPPVTAEPPKKSVREAVAEYLTTKPTSDAMLSKGRDFAKAGDMAAAFLVFRQAAEQGNASAQLELASFYDPLTQPSRGGFTPDGQRAADWYERAALAGLPEAQRKLGLLLSKGGAGLAADTGKAKGWLQQAAAQNDADAKKALDALPK
jgi:Sel1 repeat